jgi:hypothetical protein
MKATCMRDKGKERVLLPKQYDTVLEFEKI